MKQFIALLFFIGALCFSSTSHAQIVDKTTDRAKEKANNRVDRKVDQGIDKGLDAIEGLFKKKPKKESDDASDEASSDEQAQNDAMKSMQNLFGGADVELQDEYGFDKSIEMTIETIDKKGKQEYKQDMEMLFAANEMIVGMLMTMDTDGAASQSKVIMDMEQKQMVTLVDTQGMNMAMAIDLKRTLENNETNEEESVSMNFKKTGRTKEILGYTCHEYVGEDEENTYEFWTAEEDMMNFYGAFSTMQSANQKKGTPVTGDYPQGMMMEAVTVGKKKGEKTIIRVTKVNLKKAQTISTVGYQVMAMPGQ